MYMGLGAALPVFLDHDQLHLVAEHRRRLLLPASLGLRRRTPAWGGVGTIAGGAIGSLIVSLLQTGIISAGLNRLCPSVQISFNGLMH